MGIMRKPARFAPDPEHGGEARTGIVRKPVRTIADPEHGRVDLEGSEYEVLSRDHIYINPRKGTVRDGRRGDRVGDLEGGELEIPRTTWH